MNGLIEALAPAFAAGLAVQRFLEILDATGIPFLSGGRKKLYMAGLSLVLAAIFVCSQPNIRILKYLTADKAGSQSTQGMTGEQTAGEPSQAKAQEITVSTMQLKEGGPSPAATSTQSSAGKDWVDLLITILFISGGTEGLNALLKFMNYKKETAKGTAAKAQSDVDTSQIKGRDALAVVKNT